MEFNVRVKIVLQDHLKSWNYVSTTNPKSDEDIAMLEKKEIEDRKHKDINDRFKDVEYPWGRSNKSNWKALRQ